jgi:hypothetical protein
MRGMNTMGGTNPHGGGMRAPATGPNPHAGSPGPSRGTPHGKTQKRVTQRTNYSSRIAAIGSIRDAL